MNKDFDLKQPQWIPLGKIGSPWGLRGEVKFFLYHPESKALEKTDQAYLKTHLSFEPISLISVRQHGKSLLIHLEGYHSPEAASKLKGEELFLPLKDLPPRKEGEFYVFEFVGMEVYSVQGEKLGVVKKIENYGASNILVVEDFKNKKSEILIPMIPNVLKEVLLSKNKILIDPLEELF